MTDIYCDFDATVDDVRAAYGTLKELCPTHELLGLMKLSGNGLSSQEGFSERYQIGDGNSKIRRHGAHELLDRLQPLFRYESDLIAAIDIELFKDVRKAMADGWEAEVRSRRIQLLSRTTHRSSFSV